MGLFQNVVDFYDYNLQYYRGYIFRRYLFDEVMPAKEKKEFSVFENKDYENGIDVVVQSTKNWAFLSGFPGIAKYAYEYSVRNTSFKDSLRKGFGIVAVASGIGFMYGTSVVCISYLRGNKDSELNHFLASFTSVPLASAFYKDNRAKHGFLLSIYAGVLFALFKYNGMGKLYIDPHRPGTFINRGEFVSPSDDLNPYHWMPNKK